MADEIRITGMDDFFKDLDEWAKIADDAHVEDVLIVGGEALAEDVRKLPSPRSKRGGGYTHMLDSMTAKKSDKQRQVVEVGWGGKKYYGLFVERGTTKMRAQPHLHPTWNNNKERYYKLMADKLFQIRG